jgi:hypothetical protein
MKIANSKREIKSLISIAQILGGGVFLLLARASCRLLVYFVKVKRSVGIEKNIPKNKCLSVEDKLNLTQGFHCTAMPVGANTGFVHCRKTSP